MPALPLDEAGKYVAAAYVVFVALILVYVAIMAAKLAADRPRAGRAALRRAAAERRGCRPPDQARRAHRRGVLSSWRSASPTRPRRSSCASGSRSPRAARPACSASWSRRPEVQEAAAISTCNRTELYLAAPDPVGAESLALGVLAREAGTQPTELVGHLYSMRGADAALHLFRVTAGLDSMIIGEAEVQGQVKRAYELALVEGATGPILNRLFRGALAAGKRARSETGDLRARRCRCPRSRSSSPSGRSATSSSRLRRSWSAPARRRSSPPGRSPRAASSRRSSPTAATTGRSGSPSASAAGRSGSRSCPSRCERPTSSSPRRALPHHVIEREALAEVMRARRGRPLLLIDLAVPRDIHPDCRDLDGVSLHDMDDLQTLVERNASGREAEARRAESILRAELGRFERWLGSQDVVPTVAALRARADEIVARVLAENEPRWEALSDADRERLRAMARAIAEPAAARADPAPEARVRRRRRVRVRQRPARAVRPRRRERAARGLRRRGATAARGAPPRAPGQLSDAG